MSSSSLALGRHFVRNAVLKDFKKTNVKKNTTALRDLHTYLQKYMTCDIMQEFSNKINAVSVKCVGDGAGLSKGTLKDMVIVEFLKSHLDKFEEYHYGESDCKIMDIPLSLKNIEGKSQIALDWSKNTTASTKDYFTDNMMIVNKISGVWWKKSPKMCLTGTRYNKEIPAGIYLIDKNYCKEHVKLSSNNKTNTLINSQNLYLMMLNSIENNLFLELPQSDDSLTFNILNAFSSKEKLN